MVEMKTGSSWYSSLLDGQPSRETLRRAYAFLSSAHGINNFTKNEFGWDLIENIEKPPFTVEQPMPGWSRAIGKRLVRLGLRLLG